VPYSLRLCHTTQMWYIINAAMHQPPHCGWEPAQPPNSPCNCKQRKCCWRSLAHDSRRRRCCCCTKASTVAQQLVGCLPGLTEFHVLVLPYTELLRDSTKMCRQLRYAPADTLRLAANTAVKQLLKGMQRTAGVLWV
jgi:hypothetical protein